MGHSLRSSSMVTGCLHGIGGRGDGEPLVTPIVQSSTFARNSVDSTAEHAYSRVSNPTVDALERALGVLESAPPAVAFGSGLAAEAALFLSVLRADDHIICGRAVYGGTTRLIEQLLSGLGVRSTFVDTSRPEHVQQAIEPATKLIFIETPANPTLEVADIQELAAIAGQSGALLAVDNTFLTPVLQQPLECGAHVSVYSTTKYIDGHSVALGGAVVTRNEALLERLRFVRKCTGGILAPFNAWLTLQGLKTLPLRIQRQSESAAHIAQWLIDVPGVSIVYYPGWASAQQQAIADHQHLDQLNGAVVSFALEGGLGAARAFTQHLRLFTLCEHVGSVESLATHSATMTHADVAPEQRAAVGITDGLVRLSIGLEDPNDLVIDLERALAASVKKSSSKASEEVRQCTVLD